MNTTWDFNGVSLVLDLDDIATMERYEQAFTAMQQRFGEQEETASTAGKLRVYCEAIHFLFDTIFGAGTADALLGEGLHVGKCEEAYDSFLAFVQAQTAERTERHAQMVRKYTPNRAQRRTAEKSAKADKA